MLGILLADKPLGITSHDAVNIVRRRFGARRVGHAGTLDPLATGLLVMAVGPATRFLQYLPLEPKEYVAEFTFGVETTTYDREGEVVADRAVPHDLEAQFHEASRAFLGLLQQLPPMYSAVKIDGQPLYRMARQGKEVEREPRTVHIGEFETLNVSPPAIEVRVVCSGGTYLRSLAHDIGQAIGCGAHLSRLKRTRVGRFSIEQATPIDEVNPADMMSLSEALPPMPIARLTSVQVGHIRDGRPVFLAEPPAAEVVALAEPDGDVFSVARRHGNLMQPECVIPAEAYSDAL